MEDDLYDEFGNYIGPVEDSEPEHAEVPDSDDERDDDADDRMNVDESEPNHTEAENAIVLHEDKRYFEDASTTFGNDVEILIQDRDTQSIAQPVIAPDVEKKFTIEDSNLPELSYSRSYQASLMAHTEFIRNVALVGHLHHGKTSLVDMLVQETHELGHEGKSYDDPIRYTDTHVIEREKGISIHSTPITFVLPNRKGKSHLINLIDTPGHVDFVDEVAAASRMVDGFAVVVDVIEGLCINTKRVIRHAIRYGMAMVLVVNKIDRLILDLNLPPNDAYLKLLHCIEQVNDFIRSEAPAKSKKLTPELGNVVFASAKLQFVFSTRSFAEMYKTKHPSLDAQEFAKRIWGDVFYDQSAGKFLRKPSSGSVRSFVHFIMNPLQKLLAHSLGEDRQSLTNLLGALGIKLKNSVYSMDVKPMMKAICREFFGAPTALTDLFLEHLPSPLEAVHTKLISEYSGPQIPEDELLASMIRQDPSGPLVVQVSKQYCSQNGQEFYALGRVMSGTLEKGASVQVLGESFSSDDQEDAYDEPILDLWLPMARYKVPVNAVPVGNWALIRGVSSHIAKTATLVSADADLSDAFIFKPLTNIADPFFKLAVEPYNPSELPRMLEGLRKITKSFVLLKNVVEESGEHAIFGSGEMYMDCVMHDLRNQYAGIEIKVSDPVTKFSETIIQTTAIQCPTQTPNKENKLTFIAEPLEPEVSKDIETGKVDIHWTVRKVAEFFQSEHRWDVMAARNVWAFGPGDNGANVLLNDTLSEEVDRKSLNAVRDHIRGGFKWVCKEGPLCGEPIRNAKFRLIEANLSDQPILRSGGQLIPAARRACNAAFLLAGPRLLEPMYTCHVICTSQAVEEVYRLLQRRRGAVNSDSPIAGTPLYSIEGELPVIDSFGFETDVRLATSGQAAVSLVFDRWNVVPGDPFDSSQQTRPLEAAQISGLARDFVLKTRRRKGFSEQPSIASYVDAEILEKLQSLDLIS